MNSTQWKTLVISVAAALVTVIIAMSFVDFRAPGDITDSEDDHAFTILNGIVVAHNQIWETGEIQELETEIQELNELSEDFKAEFEAEMARVLADKNEYPTIGLGVEDPSVTYEMGLRTRAPGGGVKFDATIIWDGTLVEAGGERIQSSQAQEYEILLPPRDTGWNGANSGASDKPVVQIKRLYKKSMDE